MFKILTEGCEPKRGTKYSACVDLFASEDLVIGAGETKVVGLGVCIDINEEFIRKQLDRGFYNPQYDGRKNYFMKSHYLQVSLRSSIGKKGLIIPNGVGIIDMDYTGEIKIIIHNPITENHITFWVDRVLAICGIKKQFNKDNSANYTIKKGDKIAQITMLEHKSHLFGIDTDAVRDGGFGSTDKQESIYLFNRVANDNS